MLKQSLALLLAGLMLASTPCATAQTNPPKVDPHARHTAKIKAEVQRQSLRDSKLLTVELYDKTKLSGYIVSVGGDRFTLHTNPLPKTGDNKDDKTPDKDTSAQDTTGNTEIAYSSVRKLWGNGPGTASTVLRTIALGGGAFQSKKSLIVVAVLFIVVIALVASDKS